MIEKFLKENPGIKLLRRAPAGTDGKLHWAEDNQQWEVYRIANRKIYYLYKGPDLSEALNALKDFDLLTIKEK